MRRRKEFRIDPMWPVRKHGQPGRKIGYGILIDMDDGFV